VDNIAALRLASGGLPVFPCTKSNKCPCTPHGFKDASTDSAVIENLWRQHPGELIGVPTGDASGFDALDLDPRHVQAKDWWRENQHRIPRTRTHKTRSGGLHLLFRHDDRIRCGAGRIALGVDTRSTGGYIIWWPATGLPILSDAPPAPWPDFLLEHFRPKPRLVTSSSPEPIVSRSDAWLRGLVRLVCGAPEGQRNQILFWAACRAGEAVRRGKADESFVTDVLAIAATKHAGLPQSEAQRTIRSGIRRS
jgi:Bifunctional DNA primase/polymerase, N-terminal